MVDILDVIKGKEWTQDREVGVEILEPRLREDRGGRKAIDMAQKGPF